VIGLIVAEDAHQSRRRRLAAISLIEVLAGICLASLMLAVVVRRAPIFIPFHLGQSEIVVEINRSPTCPNGLLGMCDKGGTGLTYLSCAGYPFHPPVLSANTGLLRCEPPALPLSRMLS